MAQKKTNLQEIKKITSDIYDTYYALNPNGDARFGLWQAVTEATKKKDALRQLKLILQYVQDGGY